MKTRRPQAQGRSNLQGAAYEAFAMEMETYNFTGTQVGWHHLFPRSLSSADVFLFYATAVLNVALCDLQDEASGGFRKLCCVEQAQLFSQ